MTSQKPSILIVDDREDNFLVFDALLDRDGYDLVWANSGKMALSLAEKKSFVLVLLDVQMPEMNGFEVLKRLKSNSQTSTIPVIFVTANYFSREDEVLAYQQGVSDILLKPIIPEILSCKVKVFIDLNLAATAQEELKRAKTEIELRGLANAIPEIVYIRGAVGDTMYLNDKWYEYTGANRSSFDTDSYIHPDDYPRIRPLWETSLKNLTPLSVELRILGSDGNYRWFLTRSVPRLEDGKLQGWYGTSTDIHERKQAQINFEKNVDVSPAILWITEGDGSCSYLSRQWEEFTGQSEEESLGFGWLQATHPDDKERVGKIFVEANKKQVPFYTEYRLKTKDGKYRWAIDAGNPRYDQDGNYLGYAGTVFDIHDRMTAEHELKDLQTRFQKSARATDLGVWYCDLPFDELIWNAEVKNHFFLPLDARVTIDTFYQHIHPDDRDSTRLAIDRSIETHVPYDTVYRTINPDDSTQIKYIRAVGWTDYSSTGKPIRFDGITLDVTAQKFRELELRVARDEAEKANTLKSAFLANMSHEIRTPLGAMIGFADLLRDPGLSDVEKSNYTDILVRNGEQLSVIINDILDLSKVEAGHLTLEYRETSADKIATDVVSLLQVTAKDKGLALVYSSDESTPETFASDPTRVRQILVNLIGNAIKFTQFGSIKIKSYGDKNAEGKDVVCFEIEDTGIGIAEDQKEKIFEMFVQADGSMTRRFGGTGLGLALSRRLARALGGDVNIHRTEEGRGTTFLFTVADLPSMLESKPAAALEEGRTTVELPADVLKNVRALVVDDSPDNQQLIWRYLTKRGAKVDSAENGLEGYKKALSGNYDVVLMDIQMPLMDGFTATQKLRTAGYKKPIIALTAHAMTEVRAKCFNVGCTDHLSKPINPKDLIAAVASHLAI